MIVDFESARLRRQFSRAMHQVQQSKKPNAYDRVIRTLAMRIQSARRRARRNGWVAY